MMVHEAGPGRGGTCPPAKAQWCRDHFHNPAACIQSCRDRSTSALSGLADSSMSGGTVVALLGAVLVIGTIGFVSQHQRKTMRRRQFLGRRGRR